MGTLHYAKHDLNPLFLELSKTFLEILHDIKGIPPSRTANAKNIVTIQVAFEHYNFSSFRGKSAQNCSSFCVSIISS